MILTSSRPELYDVGYQRKKNIVQEYKVILNAITSVAVHPSFQLREMFVCFGLLNRILAVIGHGVFSVEIGRGQTLPSTSPGVVHLKLHSL